MTHFTLISNPTSSVRSKVSFYFNEKIKVQHDRPEDTQGQGHVATL